MEGFTSDRTVYSLKFRVQNYEISLLLFQPCLFSSSGTSSSPLPLSPLRRNGSEVYEDANVTRGFLPISKRLVLNASPSLESFIPCVAAMGST